MEVPGDIKGELCHMKTHLDQRNGTMSPTGPPPSCFHKHGTFRDCVSWLVVGTLGASGNSVPEGVVHFYYVSVMCWRSVGVNLVSVVKHTNN